MWLYQKIIVSKSHGNTSMYVDTVINFAKYHIHRGGAIGGKGGKSPLKISKKGKMKKHGVFSCNKVFKFSFSVIFNEEIRALEGLLSRF